jgi:coenzyme F420 hydrogenase subunit beta
MAAWMLEAGEVSSIVKVAQDEGSTRTVAARTSSTADVLGSAGSRYAPVGAASEFTADPRMGFIGKPCEVAASRKAAPGKSGPALSFFCAGTPSQHATDHLVGSVRVDLPTPTVRYRGAGWPGDFVVERGQAELVRLSYEKSWSEHLGPSIQWRCKLCPDGTGEAADIAVGDYWRTDERGYPILAEDEGTSVVIARTPRGAELLRRAAAAGVLVLKQVDMDRMTSSQPSQVYRRVTLGGRLIGARMAGKRIPRYTGYNLVARTVRNPWKNARAAIGTYRRVKSGRTGSM